MLNTGEAFIGLGNRGDLPKIYVQGI